jgi:hypothetical protein
VERNRTCYCRCHLHIRCQAPPAMDGRKCVHPHSTKRVARRQDPDSANRTGSPTSNGQVPARLEARRDSLHPIEIKPVTCGTAVYRRYISNCGSQHRIPENDSRTASLSCKASLSLKKCIDKAHAYSGIYRLPTAVAAVSNNGMVKEIGFFGGRICRRMPAVFAKQSLRES